MMAAYVVLNDRDAGRLRTKGLVSPILGILSEARAKVCTESRWLRSRLCCLGLHIGKARDARVQRAQAVVVVLQTLVLLIDMVADRGCSLTDLLNVNPNLFERTGKSCGPAIKLDELVGVRGELVGVWPESGRGLRRRHSCSGGCRGHGLGCTRRGLYGVDSLLQATNCVVEQRRHLANLGA